MNPSNWSSLKWCRLSHVAAGVASQGHGGAGVNWKLFTMHHAEGVLDSCTRTCTYVCA